MIRLVLTGVAFWLAIRLWPVILVLLVSLLIVGMLSPAVHWLENHGVRRGLGIGLVFAAAFIAAMLLLTLTIPSVVAQIVALFEHEPTFRASLADRLSSHPVSAPFADWLRNLRYGVPGNAAAAAAFNYSMHVFEIAAYGVSAIFLALYMMIDRDRLRGGLFALVPRTHHLRLSRVMLNTETIVGAYIRGQLITCVLIGAFTFILLLSCGVKNALALALFAAAADILPYIGAFLSIAPAVLAALGQSPTVAVIVLAAMLIYEEFESRVLIPRVYGKSLRLPSSVIFFSLLAGGTLMGLLGALLALPVAATAMMLIEELRVDLPGEQEQASDTKVRIQDGLEEEEYARRTEGVAAKQAAAIAVEISLDRQRGKDQGDKPRTGPI